ncbi:MAG: hypothetical protein ACXVWJ_20745, partial [Solirubrobacteraceae bacterium]
MTALIWRSVARRWTRCFGEGGFDVAEGLGGGEVADCAGGGGERDGVSGSHVLRGELANPVGVDAASGAGITAE